MPQNHKAALGINLVLTMHRCHHCPFPPRPLELQDMPLPRKDVSEAGEEGQAGWLPLPHGLGLPGGDKNPRQLGMCPN